MADTTSDSPLYNHETIGQIPTDRTPYAVLGYPVKHSLSPQFQQAGLDAAGLNAAYHKIEVPPEELPDAVAQMKERGFAGWNCTVPHKLAMMEMCDHLADSAKALGAVNTVLVDDGQLIGFNTDGEGWVRAIREEFSVDVRDMQILLLGAGGAGRGLAMQAAHEQCARLVLANRTRETAEDVAKQIRPIFDADEKLLGAHDRLVVIGMDDDELAREIEATDLIVNATSVGLKSYDPPVISTRLIQPHLFVYDTIYKPARTALLRGAEQAGARVANGLSMLLHQGAASFSIWTGQTAPLKEMRAALKKAAGVA